MQNALLCYSPWQSAHAVRHDVRMWNALPPDLVLPPNPALRVALVYLHAQSGADFFSDEPFAWTAGELRALGIHADLFHVHFDRRRPAHNDALQQQLVTHIREGGYGLVVLDICWLGALIGDLQTAGARVCTVDASAQYPDAQPDFRLRHFGQNRLPLLDLCAAMHAGTPLLDVPNLRVQTATGEVTSPHAQPWPPTPIALRPYCPVTDPIVLGELRDLDGRVPPVRKSLDVNSGCPFSQPVRKNPAFAGVVLDAPGVTLAGCAFCEMGGDYRALPVAETVRVTVDHIAWLQAHMPQLDEIVLRDQASLRYLPELAQAIVDAGLAPLGLQVPGRGDAILRYGREMTRAAEIFHGSGQWYAIHLVGFESFSQAQLDLYNKGVTVAEYADAIAGMRALHQQFPDAFQFRQSGGCSLILFNPWATLADLRETIDFANHNAVLEMANGLAMTRLRLYPNLPLYWKAQADGLLVDTAAPTDRGAAYWGYQAERAWRFQDARVALVEEVVRRLTPHAQVMEAVGLLDAVVRWVEARLPEPVLGDAIPLLDELPALEAAWLNLRSLWRPVRPREVERPVEQDHGRRQNQSRTVLVGQGCNQNCRTCVGHRAQETDDLTRIRPQALAAVAAHGRVVLAGREPLRVPGLTDVIAAAKDAGAQDVELVTNAGALADPATLATWKAAGVSAVSIKRHRLADADEDAYVGRPGAGAQAKQVMASLYRVKGIRWKLLLIPTRDGVHELPAIVAQAVTAGARSVQIHVLAGEVDLAQLAALHAQMVAAMLVAQDAGLPVGVGGF